MKSVELGEVAEVFGGYAFKSKDFNDTSGVPVIKISNIQGGKVSEKTLKEYLPDSYLDDYENYQIRRGDILVALSGATTGKTGVYSIERPSLLNQRVGLVRAKNGKADQKYLSYYVSKITDDILNKAQGVAQPNISTKELAKFEIPLPSLSKQKAIVAKLDRAQRLIDIDKEMLAKYDELIQSVFLEMFGDPKSNSKKIKTGKLGNYAFINMGQSPKGSSYNEEGEGEPLLNGPTEFGEKYPKEKQWTSEPKKFAEVDDILFCVRGATAGRTNLADKKYCIGRGLAAIRGEDQLDTTFIHFVLKSHYDYFQNQGQGSTFINIAKKDLSSLEVPIPSQALQNEFISASKEIENQKQVTKGSLKKSEELFSSLVQGVFG